MPVSEFELIDRYFRHRYQGGDQSANLQDPRFPVAIGDDCAGLIPPEGEQLLISVDTLVESVHFPRQFDPAYLGRRALAVCVSDLAACGAKPLAYTLALTLPVVEEAWLAAFSQSLHTAADEFGISLIGGDTTRGPLSLSIQVMGSAPPGQALLRSGAQTGDDIYVSGSLGDAAAALACLDLRAPSEHQQQLLNRYCAPSPRLQLGMALRGIASAAADVSDGLAADLGHILKASGVAATLQLKTLPLSEALLAEAGVKAVDYAMGGGDDYELCFTAPVMYRAEIAVLSADLQLPLTRIGSVAEGRGLRCLDSQGAVYPLPAGYQHF
jgi:thiamine-monophosphate kinase